MLHCSSSEGKTMGFTFFALGRSQLSRLSSRAEAIVVMSS